MIFESKIEARFCKNWAIFVIKNVRVKNSLVFYHQWAWYVCEILSENLWFLDSFLQNCADPSILGSKLTDFWATDVILEFLGLLETQGTKIFTVFSRAHLDIRCIQKCANSEVSKTWKVTFWSFFGPFRQGSETVLNLSIKNALILPGIGENQRISPPRRSKNGKK